MERKAWGKRPVAMKKEFDVIVIGGGHAGCEAALASSKLGANTALLTSDKSKIAWMSCNPAMGGLAKGQLIKEIDALGGAMGRITDKSAIQYRRLNMSKGPAVRSSRAQCDKPVYAENMQKWLKNRENLAVLEAEVQEFLVKNHQVYGVRLQNGEEISSKTVVITSGTFMSAVMHTGDAKEAGGRVGEKATYGLSEALKINGFSLRRLKTGTPPRLLRQSIDYSRTEEQRGDEEIVPFSFFEKPYPFPYLEQISCFITYTNQQTHEIIKENFERSPIYNGDITGVGPRYCPSIEDKVKRFSHKDRHQLFLEPESLSTDDIYVNGISTSLPRDVQEKFVRSVVGLENAVFTRFGYAVEYDSVDSTELTGSLESKNISGLFLAGQVNGTSGYEEAGAQGLIAGINAALKTKNREPFVLSRNEAYIGVLIDDLNTRGLDEPYRMFTSRAENRLFLREDNADLRLSHYGFKLGLLTEEEFGLVLKKEKQTKTGLDYLETNFVYPNKVTNEKLSSHGFTEIKDKTSLSYLLRRPEHSLASIERFVEDEAFFKRSKEALEQIEVQVKYEGYIKRDRDLFDTTIKNEELRIPSQFSFEKVSGLSNEMIQRLERFRPETLGKMSRLQGITPAAVASVLIHLKLQEKEARAKELS